MLIDWRFYQDHINDNRSENCFLPAIRVLVFKKKLFPIRNHMLIGTGVFPIGFKSFNYNEELPFNSFWSWTCVIIRTVIEAHYWWWSNPRHGTIQLELTCYHCMVASSRGDCPFVALRSTDMTTVRRVWHGLGCEQCNPRNVMILTHWGRVTHICVLASLVQIMVCRLVGAKPLSKPKLEYC